MKPRHAFALALAVGLAACTVEIHDGPKDGQSCTVAAHSAPCDPIIPSPTSPNIGEASATRPAVTATWSVSPWIGKRVPMP
jgi:hypothetical protein